MSKNFTSPQLVRSLCTLCITNECPVERTHGLNHTIFEIVLPRILIKPKDFRSRKSYK